MSGGPLLPSSVYLGGAGGNLFPNFYAGAGGNAAPHDEGIGVVASLGADSTAELRFAVPPTVPSGTFKLRMLALANATSGAAKVTVKDGRAPAGASPSAAALTSETQQTVTWASGNADEYKETKLALTTVPQGNDMIVVAITFNTSGWTLAQISTWLFSLIWE
jgi:hypothetical protein